MKTLYALSLAASLGLALTTLAQTPSKPADKPTQKPTQKPAPATSPAPVHKPAAETKPAPQVPEKNVLEDASPGDWLQYAVRMDATPKGSEMKALQTVIAKDAKNITLQTTGDLGTHDVKISLEKPYEPYMPVGETDAVAQKLKEGKETLTVRGKTYACEWVLVRVHGTVPAPTDCETKVWTCKDVPVTGMVKFESVSTATVKGKPVKTTLTMELIGSGKKS